MAEEKFIDSLEDLTGKVAIVTGGAAGLGLHTTIYLARKGCTVYAASRNQEKALRGIAEAEKILAGNGGPIRFHQLDLASIGTSTRSADEFRKRESRIDIIVANAGISMPYQDALSEDGFEKTFATNHLGHFVFITNLLDLLEAAAEANGEARIVVVSSTGYRGASKLDYESLQRTIPGDGTSATHLPRMFQRYMDSKLANVYFTNELDTRLRAKGIKNIYCNSCHPGVALATNLGYGGFDRSLGTTVGAVFRAFLTMFGSTSEDVAKTQVYLAASKEIREKDVHGQYWTPTVTWRQRYAQCHDQGLTALGKDEEEQRKLWKFSEAALKKYNEGQNVNE